MSIARKAYRILIVGNPSQEHIGAHFLAAAKRLGWEAEILDLKEAWSRGNKWVRRFFYHVLGKRPTALRLFSQRVVEKCRHSEPNLLLTTGVAPVIALALREIGSIGVMRTNYLTDDPWNHRNTAHFFWQALKEYDLVFNPRTANLEELRNHGCRRVEYLPFAYNPDIHFFDPPKTVDEWERFGCDVAIVGGADEDRLPLARTILNNRLKLRLYGGYWNKFSDLKPYWHGFVYDRKLRMAVSAATVNLVMGRKANRDGHAMRSLEIPAMQGCVLAEDTQEHRWLYGNQGVRYYKTIEEMVEQAQALAKAPDYAQRISKKLAQHIYETDNTYQDRLMSITRETIKWVHANRKRST